MPVCGDGVLEPGEQCDDGVNNGDTLSCKSDCTDQACGDGFVGPGEGCDDGNVKDGDGCSAACVSEGCGDGVVDGGEACDDGANGDPDDGCTDLCTLPGCGDTFVQPSLGESCDAGVDNSDQGACTLACKAASCGDGLVWAGQEVCDDGVNDSSYGGCTFDCKSLGPYCGDMSVNGPELCDDGVNDGSYGGCAVDCTLAPHCGDGVVNGAEECDDANLINTDTCTNACKSAVCGDGIVQAPEQCDDANLVNADTCSLLCHKTPLTVSTVLGAATPTYGGGGGNTFLIPCTGGNIGKMLVGFSGNTATNVEGLQSHCGKLVVGVVGDMFVVETTDIDLNLKAGGNGGVPFNSPCPAGQVIVGFSGRSSTVVHAIRFSCAPLLITEDAAGFTIATGMVTHLTQYGGNAGNPIPQTDCPAGQIGRDGRGRHSSAIDQFGLGCATFGLTF